MLNSPLSLIRFRIIFSACWLVLMSDHTLVLYLFGLPWREALTDSIINNTILLLSCLLIMNTLRYYLPQRDKFLNIFVCCLVLTIIAVALSELLLRSFLDYYEQYEVLLAKSIPIRFSIAFLLLGCITMISVLWYNWEEQKENEERKATADKMTREAELFKLRQQLQPHFLFNSLNSINALIGARPAEARKMVQQLSDFLRGTLKKEEDQWVKLEEEFQYLQLYLEIEKVRFGNRLKAVTEISPAVANLVIPALLLQPVVENAIKFGLYDTTGETVIMITTCLMENELVIKVSNPYDAETSGSQQGTGFGLSSIRRRLYLLFARNDLLSTHAEGNNFITTVKIPQYA